jgi:hypothetical protein
VTEEGWLVQSSTREVAVKYARAFYFGSSSFLLSVPWVHLEEDPDLDEDPSICPDVFVLFSPASQ